MRMLFFRFMKILRFLFIVKPQSGLIRVAMGWVSETHGLVHPPGFRPEGPEERWLGNNERQLLTKPFRPFRPGWLWGAQYPWVSPAFRGFNPGLLIFSRCAAGLWKNRTDDDRKIPEIMSTRNVWNAVSFDRVKTFIFLMVVLYRFFRFIIKASFWIALCLKHPIGDCFYQEVSAIFKKLWGISR